MTPHSHSHSHPQPGTGAPGGSRAADSDAQGHTAIGARFHEIAAMSRSELETTFLRGAMPDLQALVGWEFRGLNLPAWAARALGIRKFIKGFTQQGAAEAGGEGDAQVVGYNRPAVQSRVGEPWEPALRRGASRRFGWYRVSPVDATTRDNLYLHSALLDYSRGGNRLWDPTRGLRDYLVQVDPGDPDLYLGKAYFALGPARVPATFFLLARWRRAPDQA